MSDFKKVFFMLMVIAVSCKVNQKAYEQKMFKVYEIVDSQEVKAKYKMDVPKGYKDHLILSGHGKEHRFIYEDSLILYFSNDKGSASLNEDNIHHAGFGQKIFSFSMGQLGDSLELQGKDVNQLYWKEFNIREVRVGYINVPKEKKEIFDKAISSLREK